MVTNKRQKSTRQKGHGTYGWGSMKKRRGLGNRGGSGKSGTGKRADSKKPSYWKNTKLFGKHGFKAHKIKPKALTLNYLEEHIEKLTLQKKATMETGTYKIDLNSIGYQKLLAGKTKHKIIITCKFATAKAQEAVANAGGQIILPVKEAHNNGAQKPDS